MSEFRIMDIPRSLEVNGESFSEADVRYLRGFFPEMDQAQFDKKKLRKDLIVQKAIRAGVALCNMVQAGTDSATLSLTQTGRSLLGKV